MTDRRPVVLMIDDNPADAQMIGEALEWVDTDATFVSVENAAQAFRYLQGQPPFVPCARPDLILLDLRMPLVDGHAVLRQLRGDPLWRDIPVVVLTSSRLERDRERALALGARRFASKPAAWDGYVDVARAIRDDLRDAAG
jgi:CheY-like chemotaxis protein